MPTWTQDVGECPPAATPTPLQPPHKCSGPRVPWALRFSGQLDPAGNQSPGQFCPVEHSFHSCSAVRPHQIVIAPCSVCGEPGILGGFTTRKSEGSPVMWPRTSRSGPILSFYSGETAGSSVSPDRFLVRPAPRHRCLSLSGMTTPLRFRLSLTELKATCLCSGFGSFHTHIPVSDIFAD